MLLNLIKHQRQDIEIDKIYLADMEANKKLSPVITGLLLRGRKTNISHVFTAQSYFKVPKTIRLNATYYFIMKIPNKRELQNIASNSSSDTEFNDFRKPDKNYTKQPFSCLVNDQTLPSDNPLRFRKHLL